MQLLLIMLPPSIVGVVAIVLCLAPKSGLAAESSATISKTSTVATYAAAGNAVFLGLTANELAALGGLVVAILSMVVGHGINVWFRYQSLELERRRFERGNDGPCDRCAQADRAARD